MVLAQLGSVWKEIQAVAKFPSHYGSRSTIYVWGAPGPDGSFHPTMVLAQRRRQVFHRRAFVVSIPLWFSLNVVSTGAWCGTPKRFHPTMVLAQQPLLQKLYRITGGKVKSSCENITRRRERKTREKERREFAPLTRGREFSQVSFSPLLAKIGYLII